MCVAWSAYIKKTTHILCVLYIISYVFDYL